MSVAAIVLAHAGFGRVEQLVRGLTAAGIKVAVHIDARSKRRVDAFQFAFKDDPDVVMVPRIACEWGRFSLVEASLNAAELVLKTWPDTRHVTLLSGVCLPVRPLRDLVAFLDAHPDTDFIESVPVAKDEWVKGGLSSERFTLYFPFSYQRQRWLFDRWVRLQRRLGIKRKPVHGIEGCLGSQWWCLTATTLRAILSDPQRADIDAYFRYSWIPDETYFQSLVPRHARTLERRSLTFAKFDTTGRPFVLYDDHLTELQQMDHFFARKIWSGAEQLYRTLLDPDQPSRPRPGAAAFLARVKRSEAATNGGRVGLRMQGRFPAWNERTAAPYLLFDGFDRAMPGFRDWLREELGLDSHGHLFGTEIAEFAGGAQIGSGNTSAKASVRDYEPTQWFSNLIWMERHKTNALMFEAGDSGWMAWFFANDPHANIFRLAGVLQADPNMPAFRLEHERRFISELGAARARARIRAWEYADFKDDPQKVLQELATAVRALTQVGESAEAHSLFAAQSIPRAKRAAAV